MLTLFGIFSLGPTELIVLALLALAVIVALAVVVVVVVVLTRSNRGGPDNE
jgi:hypothetical protein